MRDPGFRSLTVEKAIEVAHIAGMAIGVGLAVGSAERAREAARGLLCQEHLRDVFFAAHCLAYSNDRKDPR